MSVYVSMVGQSMAADKARLEHIAMNMANVATPGYKRVFQVSLPIESSETPPSATVHWDGRAGAIQTTGQALDVALLGEGYFEVLTEQGIAYTRKGKFTLDPQGRLVTQDGYAVNGQTGPIRLETSTPIIKANGQIYSDAADHQPPHLINTIKVVAFDDQQHLQAIGQGLWMPADGVKPNAVDTPILQQGAVEGSNVNTATEMIQLIETVRHFETMQKVLQLYDDVMGMAVKKLGEF